LLNKAAKIALVSTSLAPICLTLWFVEFSKGWDWQQGWGYFLATVLMVVVCFGLVWLSARKLESLPVKIKSIRTADKEIVGFLLVYLLPLVKQAPNAISMPVLLFVAIFFFLIIYNAHVYHFNPLLGMFGYHFYEATIEGDITFVLITRQSITHCKSISRVVQLTEYMILDVNHA
jgi:hypothetical protein